MNDSLRAIAVTVESASKGFRWVLLEKDAQTEVWTTLERSKALCESYKQAMADGLVELESLMDDLNKGPRMPIAVPETATAEEMPGQAKERSETSKTKFFGFGPAR